MGKIIAKNIKGMGWKLKFSLIAMFTLVFSVMIYQGWHQLRNADAAAVANTTQWSILGSGAVGTLPAMTLAKGTGANRILVVKIAAKYTTATTAFAPVVTYGGQTLSLAVASTTTSSTQKIWFGYLNESGITAATGTTPTVAVTFPAAPTAGVGLSAAFYSNVDQTTPVSSSRAVSTGTAATTPTTGALTGVINGWAIYGSNLNGASATTTTPAGYTKHFDTANGTLYEDSVGSMLMTATSQNPRPTWASAAYAYAVVLLNPATTTLGNGVTGVAANVAPGASAQKIDGFSLATTTVATTDSVTGLTVTSTGTAAIASVQIWNEAGTTQYFTTQTTPAGNVWTFSGGTAIPVTNTAANYKILVTYNNRATAPAVNTATTASVTAITSSNLLAGTDTADTILTLLNTHAASTWGTNTATTAITLNWTYGTAGQSVIVVRYASAKTDTTKPTDGTIPSLGSAYGTGGTVRYIGGLTTFVDNVGLVNGTTYYYKIFEYDAFSNFYNATDVWTAALVPSSGDSVAPVVTAGFAATTPGNAVNVPISGFAATDAVGVSGYLVTINNTPPSAALGTWTATAPATFNVGSAGTYTLYPWAKDASGNVSSVYGAPVTVVVDTTPPVVSGFTVPAQAIRVIPVTLFTATDVSGSGVNNYAITTTATAPSSGWVASAPTSYTVATDGTYTLYPWVKDAAGNISALFGTPRTVQVDGTAPTGLTSLSPLDTALDQPITEPLVSSTATDSGVGGVMYYFQLTNNDLTFSQNSGWISGTTYQPTGTVGATTYTWSVKAKDSLGNETPFTVPKTYTTSAACVSNDPTMTLLTPTGGVVSTITSDGGTAVYNLKIINNDYGSCGLTDFNLSVANTNIDDFDAATLSQTFIQLNPGAQTTLTVSVKAKSGIIGSGTLTRVTFAGDVDHLSTQSGNVTTTLNVVGCTINSPLLIIGPDNGYINKGGVLVYTVTVKNTNTGTGCTDATFTLNSTDSNLTAFNASTFSPANTVLLNADEQGSVSLTVSAKAAAVKGNINITSVGVSSPGYPLVTNKTATSTVGNPMLHNSNNTNSTKWSANSGWGLPGTRYGEIVCTTCHVDGYTNTNNIKSVRQTIYTPYTTAAAPKFPGHNKAISYSRMVGTKASQGSLGWDSTATPRTTSSKICEVCHTYDATKANGVNAHSYTTSGATLTNHYNTDGQKDCISCHKHNAGFGVGAIACNGCHGDPAVTTITAANRYDVAPPVNSIGVTGTLSGKGLVSNNPKVGAHQTHLKYTNGFSNYSTVDFRCTSCHGPIPTDFAHANGTTPIQSTFQGMAKRGTSSPTWNAATLTCANTYCHNPAGSGIINAANAGTNTFVSWTSASYLGDTAKTEANCNRCHKSPNAAGTATLAGTAPHTGVKIADNCIGCHGHEGDTQGIIGQRHMDGVLAGGGTACNGCHAYDAADWSTALATGTNGGLTFGGTASKEGIGAHAKHITLIKTLKTISLSPISDYTAGFGVGNAAAVCGVCHSNNAVLDHTTSYSTSTTRSINFGGGSTVYQFGASAPVYGGSGVYQSSSASAPKTCSNLSCHYFTSPVWSTY